MSGIGLDIGTTTICGVAMNENGEVLCSVTLPNDAAVPGKYEWEKLQDADRILNLCHQVLDRLKDSLNDHEEDEETAGPRTLGISGQMHGILYVDREGCAVSPLYSWQDGRGNQPFGGKETYCGHLSGLTGYEMASGYGLTTHYYNLVNALVPANAAAICTIGDYIAMKLSGKKRPVLHKSMAASLGLYDLKNGTFDTKALAAAGIDPAMLPEISGTERYLSEDGKEIPAVAMALGDNQASFYGSVSGESKVLVNIGTGSQVSVYTECYDESVDVEYRPYIGGSYLMVGAPLCGGASYALLRDFFCRTVQAFTGQTPADPYAVMNRLAEQAWAKEERLQVDTRFRGTRKEPDLRGEIKNVSFDNFTPEDLSIGILRGMSAELYEIYRKIPGKYRKTDAITGSGNGIRRNPVLQWIIEEMFGVPVRIPRYEEEASRGAALYAMSLS